MKPRRHWVALSWPLLMASPAGARLLQVDPELNCPDPPACFSTINAAMTAALAGDSVLVREWNYGESVALKDGVVLLGGYDASFTVRDPVALRTTISGGNIASAITSGPGVTNSAVVDGFVLTAAGGTPGAAVAITGGAPIVRNNEISGNILTGIAGGVYISGGSTARIEGNRIQDNQTQGSGGGVRVDFSFPTIIGNTIERNSARHSGGGIHVVGGACTISQNVIRGNVAGDGGGGGVHLQAVDSPTALTGNDIEDNRAPYGAGVMIKDEGVATFSDNDFSNDVAAIAGGGIAVLNRCDVTLTSNRFTNCVATTSHGGGVFVFESDADVTGIDPTGPTPDASFVGCTAEVNGGGFYAIESGGVLSGVRFQNCTADSSGGGAHVARSLYTISENLIVDCVALEAGGLGVLFNGSGPLLQCSVFRNTVYGCTATGGSLFGGGVTVMGNGQENIAILAANLITHTRQGSALRCKRSGTQPQTARPTIFCSTFHLEVGNSTPPSDTVGGTNCQSPYSSDETNRIGDPLYCDASNGNFKLQNCSPDYLSACPPGGDPGVDNRGAAAGSCGCGLASIESTSWGRIKASYR